MKIFLIFLTLFFCSCTNFKPLYKKKEFISNNLKEIAVVTDQQIYNEFSSGAKDATAIRMYLKMLYDRAGTNVDELPQYLLYRNLTHDFVISKPSIQVIYEHVFCEFRDRRKVTFKY